MYGTDHSVLWVYDLQSYFFNLALKVELEP